MTKLYSSNQPPKSTASNYRISSQQSNMSGSVNSKQFAQVRLRQDLSIKSNKSPNRYTGVVPPG